MDSAPRRSWIPLSLVLLLAATGLATGGWTYFYARGRVAAIRYVWGGGGGLALKSAPDWWPERARASFPNWPRHCEAVVLHDSCRDLRRVAPLHEIREMDIWGGIADAEFREIRRFRNLESLFVESPTISDAGLEALRSCRRLRQLQVGSPHMTNASLQALAGLPLRNLWLNGTSITDAGLTHLARMRLEILSLDGTGVTDAGLAALSHPSLTSLSLRGTAVTAKGLLVFRNRKSLTISIGHVITQEEVCELRTTEFQPTLDSDYDPLFE